MLTTISSQMEEIEVINVLKRYSDKKTECDKITSFYIYCCDLVTFSTFLVWSKVQQNMWQNMCKAKYKKLGNGQIHYNYFSITTTSRFFKRFVFHAISFVMVTICILVRLLGNISMHYNQLSITYNQLSISSFSNKLSFHVSFILLDCDIHLRKFKKV